MTEQLFSDDDQQENRAREARAFADAVEEQKDGALTLTLKGEAIEIIKDGKELVVVANADKTFSMTNGSSHLSTDEMLKHVLS